jgi:hypothetical protein
MQRRSGEITTFANFTLRSGRSTSVDAAASR